MGEFLIYGATGYTGRLAAEHAVARGLRPILAGRNAESVKTLADSLGLTSRAFSLDDPDAIRDGIAGLSAVLHAAGPFSATSTPMAQACLTARVHYIDVTGEIDVFEALASRDDEAKKRNVMLLPGAGFDVVPSDCLAAHVAARLPEAARLRLSIGGFGGFSRGTAKTMLESVAFGTRVRRSGRIVELAETPRATADFGSGDQPTIGLGWGDVATAWHSTRIPEIEVYFQASPELVRAASVPKLVKRLLAAGPSQRLLKRLIETRMPPGPTREQRENGSSVFLAEAWDSAGNRVASRLATPEAYKLTAITAVEIARRAAVGDVPPGYHTPSTAYGADFILGFEGVTRTDL